MEERDHFKSKNMVKCARRREITFTSFKMFWEKTPRPPPKYVPPHTQNAADALGPMCDAVPQNQHRGHKSAFFKHNFEI